MALSYYKAVFVLFFILKYSKCDTLLYQNPDNIQNYINFGNKNEDFKNVRNIRSAKNAIDQFKLGLKNPDIFLHITELIRKNGYNVQQHTIKTVDGYILNLFRIPSNGPAVFLMHGLMSSADDWITNGVENGIAYLLANEGYDVWMGNARGNKHSRQHERLSPNSPQFWDFSWDEIGRFDLPAMIDYVLKITYQKQLKYVGHSQGTTSFFVMCSERPEYNEKVSIMVALSAVAWMSHVKSPVLQLLAPFNPELYHILQLIGQNEFLPDNLLVKSVTGLMCGTEPLYKLICSNMIFLIAGFSYAQLNVTNLPVIFSHTPAGCATKQLVHYGQEIDSGRFRKFDYKVSGNKMKYGRPDPPDYPVEKISAPVALFYSDEDWLASLTDVNVLRNKLQRVVEFYKVPVKFNHLDFLWSKDVKKFIASKIIELFKKF